MPAGILQNDHMVSARVKPWHGLGTIVEGLMTAREAIEKARLGWTVSLRPLMTQDGLIIPTDMPCYATVRDDTEDVLGIVGKGYMPLQNDAAFEFFDAVAKTGKAKYETAGSLHNGKKVWILAKTGVMEVVPGDEIHEYLLLSSSHDGSEAVRMGFTKTRVVCQNTLGMASRDLDIGKRVFTAKHTENVLGKVRDAANILGVVQKEHEETEELYRAMSHRYPSYDEVDDVLKELFPADEESERSIAMAKAKKDSVLNLYDNGPNNQTAPGTAWSLYGAVTEFSQWEQKNKWTPDDKLASVWSGTLAENERKAFQAVTALLY